MSQYQIIEAQQARKLLLQYVQQSEWEVARKVMADLYGPSAHQLQTWREIGDDHGDHLFFVRWYWKCEDKTGKVLPLRKNRAFTYLKKGKEAAARDYWSSSEAEWFTRKWRVADMDEWLLDEVLFDVLELLPRREAIYIRNQPPSGLPRLAIEVPGKEVARTL